MKISALVILAISFFSSNKSFAEDFKRTCEVQKEIYNSKYTGCRSKLGPDHTIDAEGSENYWGAWQMDEKQCEGYCERVWKFNDQIRESIAKRKTEPPEPAKPCFIRSISTSSRESGQCEVWVSCPVAGADYSGTSRFECAPKNKKCLNVEFINSSKRSVLTSVDSNLVRESFGEGESASVSAKKNVCTRMQNITLGARESSATKKKQAKGVR
jgi:hypothetical protein